MKITNIVFVSVVVLGSGNVVDAFTHGSMFVGRNPQSLQSTAKDDATLEEKRQEQKKALIGLFGGGSTSQMALVDPVLACPTTKEPLSIQTSGAILGSDMTAGVKVSFSSNSNEKLYYSGRTNTYYNLLEPNMENDTNSNNDSNQNLLLRNMQVFVPPPLRSVFANALDGEEYIPMRDLFTSPSVSFAYERGWRQGFAAAGFPGADKEYEMVRQYFAPVTQSTPSSTVVDMSCATGLFTRRLAKSDEYDRVIGCDYSDSMLTEARRRLDADPELRRNKRRGSKTRVDLVRCDVGKIPMRTDTIDALHAGAAMHCWPDLESALSEIHRVLKPGGRYFATTFLSNYFSRVNAVSGSNNNNDVSQLAFQNFETTDILKEMVVKAGFDEDKVTVELLEPACVVIRAEK